MFVFVVCGEKKHINTLHFSLQYLKHFSAKSIIIVTDNTRNEIPIVHENIINIKTPSEYNNHQASIWLKTSLHRILPKGSLYCYLDSDVIAVQKKCDDIFNHFTSPIVFAKDHTSLNNFSPYAINCGCLSNRKLLQQTFLDSLKVIIPGFINNEHSPEIKYPFETIENIKSEPLKNLFIILKYSFYKHFLSIFYKSHFTITPNISLDLKNKVWHINKNITYPDLTLYRKEIARQTKGEVKWNRLRWVDKKGKDIFSCSCNHLMDTIKNKFSIEINKPDWQHWNGGVFLFNDTSHEFMEDWHKMTVEIFKDSYWKTRDQGTLIASIWKNHLQNHTCLSEEYNFLADYNNPKISAKIKDGLIISTKNKVTFSPKFIHVYHEFGTKGWDVWDCIEAIKLSNI
jgi:hypothetical protein